MAALLRRAKASTASEPSEAGRPASLAALGALLEQDLIHFSEDEAGADVLYVPSPGAVAALKESGDVFGSALSRRHQDAVRATPGAIFRFPLVGDEQSAVEVFITDWSPCHAACAVAIHRDHRLARRAGRRRQPGFLGRYVHHPLTGDQLPVLIADWVKPDFGTGAVLINPAHDTADLAYGRAIGLPIRFGLTPAGVHPGLGRWLVPPVIKTGVAIKSGLFDGASHGEARQRIFDELEAAGLARGHTDRKVAALPIARLRFSDAAADGLWNQDTGSLSLEPEATSAAERPVGFEPSAALQIVATLREEGADGGEDVWLVAAMAAAEAILAVRLLHADLVGTPFRPAVAKVVHRVEAGRADAAAVSDLSLLVGARSGEVVALRNQILEQVSSFLASHAQIKAMARLVEDRDGHGRFLERLRSARAQIAAGDVHEAFTDLRKLQKELKAALETGAASKQEYDTYTECTWLLLDEAA
ncbi:hypothetical protein WME89_12120 [Sorangium sp. So ce321]|uniref:hypothetical protein n=1 Tax=Sorangium sp. So ce321 TaxID=3133300 RepID=UPI003F64610F